MKIYVTHSPADKIYVREIKYALVENNFELLEHHNPLDLYSELTIRGMRRLQLADAAIVLLTAAGKASYRVHQEASYLQILQKNHFIIENTGDILQMTEKVYLPLFGQSHQLTGHAKELNAVKSILQDFIQRQGASDTSLIFHTDYV